MATPQIFQPQPLPRRRLQPQFAAPSPGTAGQGATAEGATDPVMQAIRNQGVSDLDRLGAESARSGAAPPQRPGLFERLKAGFPGALAAAPNVFDTQSPDFAQSFLGTGLASFQNVAAARQEAADRAAREGMAERGMQLRERGAGAAEETAHAATLRAEAENYRVHHPPVPTTSRDLTLSDREELAAQEHKYRLEEIGATAAGRPAAGGTGTGVGGRISAVDRAIMDRYNMGNRAGAAAVTRAEAAREKTIIGPEVSSPAERSSRGLPALPPPIDRASVFTGGSHGINPTFSADSAEAVNRILPLIRGKPNELPVVPQAPPAQRAPFGLNQGAYDTLRGFLRRHGTTPTSTGGAQPGPNSAGSAAAGPDQEGEGSLSNDEIEAALSQISDIQDDDQARSELESAGYLKDEIDTIMARR